MTFERRHFTRDQPLAVVGIGRFVRRVIVGVVSGAVGELVGFLLVNTCLSASTVFLAGPARAGEK